MRLGVVRVVCGGHFVLFILIDYENFADPSSFNPPRRMLALLLHLDLLALLNQRGARGLREFSPLRF